MSANLKNVAVACAAIAWALPAQADQFINDDLIVQGGLCVGLDCVNNENFGSDELKFKENNTRLTFGTAENVVMAANQSSSGGLNQFSIGQGAINPAARVSFTETGDGVTLGFNSTAVTGAVSVGSVGNERQVKQVAAGTAANDLINLGQMNAAFANRVVDTSPITAESDRLDVVSAMTAALSALQPNPRAKGPFSFSLGLGAYDGDTAAAAGISWRASDLTLVKFGVAKSGDAEPQASLSLNFSW